MPRLILSATLVVAFLFAGGEVFARLVLGLGTPPLTVRSDVYEYMFAPNQDVKRFGNRILINEVGMRSDPLPVNDETRVILVFGDSVLNGGNLTDQGALATSLLQDRLRASGEDVFVGNVSAGSWGPANMRGWLETYGDFGADTVIYILSSHDWYDLPTYEPLDPMSHPEKTPASALLEGAQRYLPRFLPKFSAGEMAAPVAKIEGNPDVANAREVLTWLLEYSKVKGQRVCLVQHLTQAELKTGAQSGHEEIAAAFESVEASRFPLQDFMPTSSAQRAMYYRDDIHISDKGQAALSAALEGCLAQVPLTSIEGSR
jgi:lysophospholipase L1-like esterase